MDSLEQGAILAGRLLAGVLLGSPYQFLIVRTPSEEFAIRYVQAHRDGLDPAPGANQWGTIVASGRP